MILVIGGAGYIGSHVNYELSKRNYETVVYDNLSNGNKSSIIAGTFIEGDTSDFNKLIAIMKTYPIDAIMHFAAYIEAGESVVDPLKFYRNNVANSITLLSAMEVCKIKNLIFSSTAAVYGEPNEIPIVENHSTLPINPYGASKKMIERIIVDCNKSWGLNYTILRYFNASGADPESKIGELHKPETHLIPLVLDVALEKRNEIKVFGTDYPTTDGSCIRDYIHVTDLADAHILALENLMKNKKSDIFNLGNGKGYSVLEVIDLARKITKHPIPAVLCERRKGDPAILVASSNKAIEALGWKPKYYKLEDIITTAWNWHKSQKKIVELFD